MRKAKRWPRQRTYGTAGLLLGAILPLAGWAGHAAVAPLRELHGPGAASAAMVTALGLLVAGVLVGRREDQLVASSRRDPLTGLWNRAALNETLEAELKRASRSARPVALVLLDLDRLKAINDCHGHLAGDAAIRHVADCLKRACRATDVACRIGGDEFAVVAPDTDRKQARNLAERIRKGVALFAAQTQTGSIPVTISMGVADVVPTPELSVTDLLRAADQRLYAAKAAGRNRIVTHTDECPDPSGGRPARRQGVHTGCREKRGAVLRLVPLGDHTRRTA